MADNFGPNGLTGTGSWAYAEGETPGWDADLNRFRPVLLTQAVIAGGVAGNLTVTGVAVGDVLVAVTRYVGAGVLVTDIADLTSEFTITAANTINNAAGTNTTGDKLQVWWWHK